MPMKLKVSVAPVNPNKYPALYIPNRYQSKTLIADMSDPRAALLSEL